MISENLYEIIQNSYNNENIYNKENIFISTNIKKKKSSFDNLYNIANLDKLDKLDKINTKIIDNPTK